jgi:hypothetical protein
MTIEQEHDRVRPLKIRTTFWAKPMPDRRFDWLATYEDYDEGGPIGHGATEDEAIDDLVVNAPRLDIVSAITGVKL